MFVVWRWTACTPKAAAQARVALRCALDELGYDDGMASDAVLAASELIANAVEHSVGPYEIRLSRGASEVVCEVEDHAPFLPEMPLFPVTVPFAPVEADRGNGLEALGALLAERGRGLHIVHHLTKGAWGFRKSSMSTKVAWLSIPVRQ
ncbi:ATP-binding protein [Streptomyces sp. Ru87]|nr:ATP-binding protein [Streptomyces sp. Ru87]